MTEYEDKPVPLGSEDIECKKFLHNEVEGEEESTGDDVTTESGGDAGNGNEETWGNTFEYLLALIGYTVGISAVWRFPIVCARNGGGAFLVPYITLTLLIGAPLYYLEMCLGQFTGKGPWKCYEFCPLFKGVGLLMVVMSTLVVWYYQTIMVWILYYLYSSFSLELAWTTCHNSWNTDNCKELQRPVSNPELPNKTNTVDYGIISNQTNVIDYSVIGDLSNHGNVSVVDRKNMTQFTTSSAASEFWYYNVLRKSSSLDDMGSIQLHLLIWLVVAWVGIYLCLIRGVKSIGKVVYVTALFPYVLLTILLIRGVTLDGAGDGILFYITPKFDKILELQVWLDAALQVFYSLGPMWGGIMTMSSFNKFNQPILRDSAIVVTMDLFTALYAGVVVFSVIGFMSNISGIPIEEMATASGHGLAFVVYPVATGLMPTPQLWSALFFLSMILVIMDSLFTMTEVTILTIIEFIPKKFGEKRYLVNLVVCVLFILSGMIFVTNGGIYLFQLIDWYLSSFALLIGAAIESFIIGNVYGADRFSRDIESMTGKHMSRMTRILICIVIPGFSVIIFFITVVGLTAPTYPDGSQYRPVYLLIAVILGLVPLAVMFGINIKEFLSAHGSIPQRIRIKLSPSSLWAPKDRRTAAIHRTNPYRYEKTLLHRFVRNIWGTKDTPYF